MGCDGKNQEFALVILNWRCQTYLSGVTEYATRPRGWWERWLERKTVVSPRQKQESEYISWEESPHACSYFDIEGEYSFYLYTDK